MYHYKESYAILLDLKIHCTFPEIFLFQGVRWEKVWFVLSLGLAQVFKLEIIRNSLKRDAVNAVNKGTI